MLFILPRWQPASRSSHDRHFLKLSTRCFKRDETLNYILYNSWLKPCMNLELLAYDLPNSWLQEKYLTDFFSPTRNFAKIETMVTCIWIIGFCTVFLSFVHFLWDPSYEYGLLFRFLWVIRKSHWNNLAMNKRMQNGSEKMCKTLILQTEFSACVSTKKWTCFVICNDRPDT